MADHAVARLGGKTLLQYAHTPYMDLLAREGRCGRMVTVPEGFHPGSEVANTAILGYDLNKVYEGRGPLEAASIGYEMQPDDFAMRCNIITLTDGRIKNHHGGHLKTEDGDTLIKYLDEKLGNENIKFITGIQYRHLLIIKNGNKHIECAPPHDHPNEEWRPLLVKPEEGWADKKDGDRMTAQETADLINDLILKSQKLLAEHPFNREREAQGKDTANSIWPWSGGYRPSMQTLSEMFPQIKSGDVISAVDLIRTSSLKVPPDWPTPTMKARQQQPSKLFVTTTSCSCMWRRATRQATMATSSSSSRPSRTSTTVWWVPSMKR